MLARLGIIIVCFFVIAEALTVGNCIGDCQALDPFVIQRKSDGKYFRFSTGMGISIKTATNLTGPWKFEGNALPQGSSIKLPGTSNKQLWAPDVHFDNGLYYLYYAMSTFQTPNSIIGVATSPNMEKGTWQDHGETGIKSDQNSQFNAIDPNLAMINNQSYLTFGSYMSGLYQVKMKDFLHKDPQSDPYQVAFNSTDAHRQEGAFVFPKVPYYYLFLSAGLNQYPANARLPPGMEYRIVTCRSQNGTGGYVDRHGTPCTKNGGDTLLSSHGDAYGPGGQGVFNDKTLGPVLYYHYANTSIGMKRSKFQFGWNKLCFTKDGWPEICGSDNAPSPTSSKPQPSSSEMTTATSIQTSEHESMPTSVPTSDLKSTSHSISSQSVTATTTTATATTVPAPRTTTITASPQIAPTPSTTPTPVTISSTITPPDVKTTAPPSTTAPSTTRTVSTAPTPVIAPSAETSSAPSMTENPATTTSSTVTTKPITTPEPDSWSAPTTEPAPASTTVPGPIGLFESLKELLVGSLRVRITMLSNEPKASAFTIRIEEA